MSEIYVVTWEQEGQFNLAAVVIAASETQAIDAVSMYEPQNIKAIRIGVADEAIPVAVVVCQESF